MEKKPWVLTVWGVRGSIPIASADVMEYGGSTSCVSVSAGGELVIFDAGSGLLKLGRALTHTRIHILLSHLHMDHLIGLFAFQPLHDPRKEIHLYGGPGFREQLDRLICPPYWPLGLEDIPAQLHFHQVTAGDSFPLAGSDGLTVQTMAGAHPNGSLLYRLNGEQKSVTYTLDCEFVPEIARPLEDFAQNTDLLVWDASFAPGDLRPGWGHSSWEQGIAVRQASGAGTALMTHYSWEYTDRFLKEQERLAGAADGAVRFAREGMEIQV